MSFLSEQFWQRLLLVVISGATAVVVLKLWENKETVLREIRRQPGHPNEPQKLPEENDERFC